jgi:nucleoside-diphosphate-sugar epimerase
MRCFLIGSTGFVGSKVRAVLEENGIETFSLVRSPKQSGAGSQIFPTSSTGEFSTAQLSQYLVSKEIDCVVHCGNVFDAAPDEKTAEQMLYGNFLVPAKVLNSAITAKAGLFLNLASGWQLDSRKAVASPDYVATKESFRTFLTAHARTIRSVSVFANEIFGAGDSRKKLLNLAIRALRSGHPLVPQSPSAILGLTNVDRLALEIVEVLKNPSIRPAEYVYQNYSGLTVQELLGALSDTAQGLPWPSGLDPSPIPNPNSLPFFGERPMSDLAEEIRQMLLSFHSSGTPTI